MTKESEYNAREIREGRVRATDILEIQAHLDPSMIEVCVEVYQRQHGLYADGMLGPKTRAHIRGESRTLLPSPVYQPLLPGCWWSGNAFAPGRHDGRDGFCGPKTARGWPDSAGAPVIAIADGVVSKIAKQDNGWWIRVEHGNSVTSLYGHLDTVMVAKGQSVTGGMQLAVLKRELHPPHIHFEIEVAGRLVEPVTFLLEHGARQFG